MRQESDLQGREARRVSKPVPSPIGLRIQTQQPTPPRPGREHRGKNDAARATPFFPRCRGVVTTRGRKEWGSDPQGPCGLGGFRNRCRRPTLGLPFHTGSPVPERMASGSNARTARRRGRCFPSRPLTSRAAIQEYLAPSGRAPESAAESGLFESHALRHASASNGARRACPVHSPRRELLSGAEYRPRDSNPDLHGLSVVPLPIGLGRHDS